MKIVSIGLFCSDYPIALANALAKANDVTLFLSRQNLEVRFPEISALENFLRERCIVDPKVSLRLIEYPTGHYLQKVGIARDLVRSVCAVQPDVIHYQSGGNPWIPLVIPLLRRFPLVVTIHDATPHSGDAPPLGFLWAINTFLSRMADQIIVHGRQQADALTEIHPHVSGKVNVVPMGGLSLAKSPSQWQRPPDNHTVLFFGRIRVYKGINVLIEAAPLIAEHIPGLRILVAGSGECPALHRASEENPDLFEVHNQFISSDDVPSFFQRASLVVLPYLDATQSAVVPLAYLFGRPVVSTRVGSIPEIVEDGTTGYLVEPQDAEALADAIIRLLRDGSRLEAMGRSAVIKLEKELSWDAIAAKTVNVYECALGSTPDDLIIHRGVL